MEAIILAGGQGRRLRQRVPDLPKPMALIAGRPFLGILLDRLADHNVGQVTLSVGYMGEAIRSYFGNRYRGMRIEYSSETEPLGTGGAVVQALQLTSTSPVLVLNGDTYLDLDYCALLEWYSQDPVRVAMVLRKVSDAGRYGIVSIEGETVIEFEEKGTQTSGLVNTGVYILNREVFRDFDLPLIFSLERDFLQAFCQQVRPRAYVADGYFIDIGIPADYDRAQRELRELCYR